MQYASNDTLSNVYAGNCSTTCSPTNHQYGDTMMPSSAGKYQSGGHCVYWWHNNLSGGSNDPVACAT